MSTSSACEESRFKVAAYKIHEPRPLDGPSLIAEVDRKFARHSIDSIVLFQLEVFIVLFRIKTERLNNVSI